MKLAVVSTLATLLAGCIGGSGDRVVGSGDVVRQERSLGACHQVELGGAARLQVTVGGPQSVLVEAQPNIAALIETTVSNGTLKITDTKQYTSSRDVVVRITVPSIDGLEISGFSDATITGAHGPKLDISVSGTGSVTASGQVDRLSLACGGAGNAQLQGLVARDAVVSLSGVGNAEINATGTLDVSISGVGSVRYRGSARVVHQSINGVGSVSHV
jgi:hypothetical protein